MKIPRRQFLHLAADAATMPVMSSIVTAQTYPARLLRFIVAYPPGGAADTAARIIGQWLSERIRQPVVVEWPPGTSTIRSSP
jgi:tripartite-type tricarboxylate transporter receptor subunit TctC